MSEAERDLGILRRIIRYCSQIDEAVLRFGRNETVFVSDTVYQNAVALCLLPIGELAGSLSEAYRAAHPGIPRRQIRALRNLIAHNYGAVDAETAWEIVQNDIPALRCFCEAETRNGWEP